MNETSSFSQFECCTTLASRMRGLIGRREYRKVLVLAPCHDVHTYGMRDAIDVAFVSPTGKVIAVQRRLEPRGRASCKQAYATLERIAADGPWFEVGDRIELAKLVGDSLKGRKRK